MTHMEAKELLTQNGIEFSEVEYEDESQYWHHTTQFPRTKSAKKCKVIALVIRSKNHIKNIELQFNLKDTKYIFEELRFGGFCFEMFDYNPEMLETDLITIVNSITSGNIAIIESNNLKKKSWNGDASFDLSDEDDLVGYDKAIRKIKKKKTLFEKLISPKMQFEIFDWENYQCIVK